MRLASLFLLAFVCFSVLIGQETLQVRYRHSRNKGEECPICMSTQLYQRNAATCPHCLNSMCRSCWIIWRNGNHTSCPLCRGDCSQDIPLMTIQTSVGAAPAQHISQDTTVDYCLICDAKRLLGMCGTCYNIVCKACWYQYNKRCPFCRVTRPELSYQFGNRAPQHETCCLICDTEDEPIAKCYKCKNTVCQTCWIYYGNGSRCPFCRNKRDEIRKQFFGLLGPQDDPDNSFLAALFNWINANA